MASQTLADKVRRSHAVLSSADGEDLTYIDLHMLHEVNTPQAFDRLRAAGRTVRRPDLTVATEDHSTPTVSISGTERDPARRRQRKILRDNCRDFGIPLYRLGQPGQGIYAVIAPELGLVHPGMTIVCCDSHATTLGAFGALSFGIGTSQVEHVLATQTLPMRSSRNMVVTVDGRLAPGSTAKDLMLALIAKNGTSCGQGYVVEYRGEAISRLSMEARMTLCNMSVELGSRAGIVAPDEVTFDYLGNQPESELDYWRGLRTDPDAVFDKQIYFNADSVSPYVSWGTNPGQSVPLSECVPDPDSFSDPVARTAARAALRYMDLRPGTPMREIAVNVVFVGSCTNGRIEDLRAAAEVLRGRRVSRDVQMVIVPGSMSVRAQAVTEGLDRVFAQAGADFRVGPGCSMCCSIGEDRLEQGQRAASTSNRNFEGRQGTGARTHLVSPPIAAATAVAGRLAAPADL